MLVANSSYCRLLNFADESGRNMGGRGELGLLRGVTKKKKNPSYRADWIRRGWCGGNHDPARRGVLL